MGVASEGGGDGRTGCAQLWLNGEKSLVFCFYIETGRALRSHISRALRLEIISRAAQALGIDASDEAGVLAALDGLAERLLRSDTPRRTPRSVSGFAALPGTSTRKFRSKSPMSRSASCARHHSWCGTSICRLGCP